LSNGTAEKGIRYGWQRVLRSAVSRAAERETAERVMFPQQKTHAFGVVDNSGTLFRRHDRDIARFGDVDHRADVLVAEYLGAERAVLSEKSFSPVLPGSARSGRGSIPAPWPWGRGLDAGGGGSDADAAGFGDEDQVAGRDVVVDFRRRTYGCPW